MLIPFSTLTSVTIILKLEAIAKLKAALCLITGNEDGSVNLICN